MTDADERQAIDLNVGGPDAVQKAKAMLSGYDIDDDAVTRISIQVFERAEPEQNGETPGEAAEDTGKTGSTRLTEDDRELKGIQSQSSHHLVLATIDALDADEVTPSDVAEALGRSDVTRNHTSTVMSKLYRRRLLDRESGQRPYTYWLTRHGEAELDDHGRDVSPDDVGGIWTANDD